MFLEKKRIYTPLFLTPYLILELASPFEIGIIDNSRRWRKLNFGPLREARLNQRFYLLYTFLGINGMKSLGQPLDVVNDLDLLLPFKRN